MKKSHEVKVSTGPVTEHILVPGDPLPQGFFAGAWKLNNNDYGKGACVVLVAKEAK